MKSNIFIPQKINVGFQKREGTYTGKLAYIIYFDEKGVLRKEASWDSWREKDIDNIIADNEPMSGFVLNKKAGGYSTGWNHRQTYCRVYDPRGFEFEITIPNLLFILENTNSIKGKGLEGEFVYGWDGKDLILIPVDSPDYKEISQYNEILHSNNLIKAKDLIIGASYKTKQNEEWIYMGKFDYYGYRSNGKKQFWFYNNSYNSFTQLKSLGDKLIKIIDSNCSENYASLFDSMECLSSYSPVDETKSEYVDYNLDYFKEIINEKIINKDYWWSELKVYSNLEDKLRAHIKISKKDRESNVLKAIKKSKKLEKRNSYWNQSYEYEIEYDEVIIESEDIEQIFNHLKPQYKNIYLKNGKLKGGIKNNE